MHIVARISWVSDGWTNAATAADRQHSKFDHDGRFHEERNFAPDFGVRHGFKHAHAPLGPSKQHRQGVDAVFFASRPPGGGPTRVVGCFAGAEVRDHNAEPFLKEKGLDLNVRAPEALAVAFDPEVEVPIVPSRHLRDGKELGQKFTYATDESARRLLDDAIASHDRAGSKRVEALRRVRAWLDGATAPHSTVVIGAWPDVSESALRSMQAQIDATGGCATWWSFPLVPQRPELKAELVRQGFRVALASRGRVAWYYEVAPGGVVEATGTGQIRSPWPENTMKGDLRLPGSPARSEQRRLWFRLIRVGSVEPNTPVAGFIDPEGKPVTMGPTGFRVGRPPEGIRFVPFGGGDQVTSGSGPLTLVDRLRAELREKGQLILSGPPGTGKTWLARRIARPEQPSRRPTDVATWLMVANPASEDKWDWEQLAESEEGFSRWDARRSHARCFTAARPGDLVFGYSAGEGRRVLKTLAVVSQGRAEGPDRPEIEIGRIPGIGILKQPVTMEAMRADPVVAKSGPVASQFRASMHELTRPQALALLELVRKENPAEAALVDRLLWSEEADPIGHLPAVTFHPSFAYEDFVEGIRPVLDDTSGSVRYTRRDGVFTKLCRDADADRENAYFLLVDEINRGNIPAIFGELITLLERDKRAWITDGKPSKVFAEGAEATHVTLPVSGKRFSVPPNVFVIGTMNTADRSISLVDHALRRRFRFEEVAPDPALVSADALPGEAPVSSEVAPLLRELGAWLASVNERITRRLDRDHAVGHAYLLPLRSCTTAMELKQRFAAVARREILPLLREYFYEDVDDLEFVLPSMSKIERDGQIGRPGQRGRFAGFKHLDPDALWTTLIGGVSTKTAATDSSIGEE